MKKFDLFLTLTLLFSLLLGSFGAFAEDCQAVQQSTLRLHILANSDSPQDQALKLMVRDRILKECGDLFSGAASAQEAKARMKDSLPRIKRCAQSVLTEQGCPAAVSASLVTMPFETRRYEGFTMPAGVYDAVRVTIGKAEGHNWWCVLFPPLCLPAAQQSREDAAQAEQYRQEHPAVQEGFELHFALWEWLTSLFG